MKFSGQTDKVLKVQLESTLLSARWGLPAVALGGKIPIEVETRFVADGSDIKIMVKDAEGSDVETLEGKVYGNLHRVIFKLAKPNKTGGMYFEAELAAHRLKGVGPKIRVLPPVQITDLKWLDDEGAPVSAVSDGQKVEMCAKVKGCVDGTDAYIAVFCKKADPTEVGAGNFPVKVKEGKVSVKWTVRLPGGPRDIAVQVDLDKYGLEYFQPVFTFEAGCLGVSAKSPEARLDSWIEYEFPGPGKAILVLPDGTEETKDVPENGILRVERPKVGRVRIKDFTPVGKDGKPLGPEVLPGEEAEGEAAETEAEDKGEKQKDAETPSEEKPEKMLFPLKKRPDLDYKTGGRRFGADRNNGSRTHAGCDLIVPAGTDIRAVADGRILAFYSFYLGTFALEVDHGGYIVRYSEVDPKLPAGVSIGSAVTRGQSIAKVGLMTSGSHMLHFERYGKSATGPLTQRNNPPYQRRSDLEDPAPFLDEAEME